VEHLAKVIRFPGPGNATSLVAGLPSDRDSLGVQRAGDLSSRAVALLGLAMNARQARQLTAEALAILRRRLAQATSEAELDACAANIPGAGRHEQRGET
jgi:hypothetical protein